MPEIGYIIRKEAVKARISLRKLEAQAGISENYIHTIIQKNDCAVSTLKSIAKVLKVPIATFFPSDDLLTANEPGSDYGKKENCEEVRELNAFLREQVRAQQVTINSLSEALNSKKKGK